MLLKPTFCDRRADREWRAYCAHHLRRQQDRDRPTLEEAELLDDTTVVFTGDHGDMLGELSLVQDVDVGSFDAGTTRDGRTGHRAQDLTGALLVGRPVRPCSIGRHRALAHVGQDLATLLVAAAAGATPTLATALGEYARRARRTRFAIRRGRWKYVHCDIDPPMLFDMDADPDELQGLRRSVLRELEAPPPRPRALGRPNLRTSSFPADA